MPTVENKLYKKRLLKKSHSTWFSIRKLNSVIEKVCISSRNHCVNGHNFHSQCHSQTMEVMSCWESLIRLLSHHPHLFSYLTLSVDPLSFFHLITLQLLEETMETNLYSSKESWVLLAVRFGLINLWFPVTSSLLKIKGSNMISHLHSKIL